MGQGVLLVTGGSRGIGAAVVRRAAADGWDVCFTYASAEAAAGAVVADVQALGRSAVAVRADAASEEETIAAFAEAERLGPLGGVVVNAGIVGPKVRVDELSVERLERTLAVNTVGAFLCCREAVLRMSTAHCGSGGSIVLVTSAAARIGGSGEFVDYAASKGAVETLTVGLAREVAREGIRVNGVRPGVIDTDIHASGGQPDRIERLIPNIPLARVGSAEEVAEGVVWLLGDGASYVTGTILDVTGGR